MALSMFWVDLSETSAVRQIYRLGIGVTANDDRDARAILRDRLGPKVADAITSVRRIRYEDIDDRHVRPNMGAHVIRGVWFPSLAVSP
jgi:hypothetical protein